MGLPSGKSRHRYVLDLLWQHGAKSQDPVPDDPVQVSSHPPNLFTLTHISFDWHDLRGFGHLATGKTILGRDWLSDWHLGQRDQGPLAVAMVTLPNWHRSQFECASVTGPGGSCTRDSALVTPTASAYFALSLRSFSKTLCCCIVHTSRWKL